MAGATSYDRLLTVLMLAGLRTRLGMRGTDFIHALGRTVPTCSTRHSTANGCAWSWTSYENSNRLYLDGPVTVIPKTVGASGARRTWSGPADQ